MRRTLHCVLGLVYIIAGTTLALACDPGTPIDVLFKDRFATVSEAAEKFSCALQLWVKQSDHRAHFLQVYLGITRRIHDALNTPNFFQNQEWMTNYTVTFANYYRMSAYNWETNRKSEVPLSWQIAFAHAQQKDLLIIQNALLGINAHILRDLAHAIDNVDPDSANHNKYIFNTDNSTLIKTHITKLLQSKEFVDTGGWSSSKFSDSTKITDVLIPSYKVIEDALKEFYAPVVNISSIDIFVDWASEFGIAAERTKAFWVAVLMRQTGTWGRYFLEQYLEHSSTATAVIIDHVPKLLAQYFTQLKELEGPDSVATMCQVIPLPCE